MLLSTTNYDIAMDLLKAKIYLDKINREFTRMLKDPENVPRIDVDITLSYVRELYDAFLSESQETGRTAPAAKKHVPEPAPVIPPPAPVVVTPPPAPAPPPPVVVTPPPVVVTPPPPVVVVPPPAPEPPPPPPAPAPPPVVEIPVPSPAPEPAPTPVVTPPPAPAHTPPAHKHHSAVSSADAEVLFEYKEAKELSEKLSETPISDLKRAIALNDKLLLTRELFGGDNSAFDQTLSALNSFSGFEQAKQYLIHNCIGTFDWLDKKRSEPAKGFIRLVRRRYK